MISRLLECFSQGVDTSLTLLTTENIERMPLLPMQCDLPSIGYAVKTIGDDTPGLDSRWWDGETVCLGVTEGVVDLVEEYLTLGYLLEDVFC